MSFARPTLTDLVARARADLDARLPGADSRLPRSVLDVLARVHAGAAWGLYGYLDAIAADGMPDTASSDALDRWATIWGVARKAATAAAGTVQVAGLGGAVLPAASVLLRGDGVAFVTGDVQLLDAGAASVAVTAVDAGAAGDTPAGTALTFASPAIGVGAVATVAAGSLVGGGDEEADAALLGRLVARIQAPPSGGAGSDYLAWALAQPEVTRAWVYPSWLGAGSVGVAVVMDGRAAIFPTADDLAAIQAAIEPLRPVTATLTVFAPVPYPTPFLLHLTPDTPATRAAVLAELTDLYAREARPGGTMLISHIREAIGEAAGIADYRLLAPAADVTAEAPDMPTIGAVTWL